MKMTEKKTRRMQRILVVALSVMLLVTMTPGWTFAGEDGAPGGTSTQAPAKAEKEKKSEKDSSAKEEKKEEKKSEAKEEKKSEEKSEAEKEPACSAAGTR